MRRTLFFLLAACLAASVPQNASAAETRLAWWREARFGMPRSIICIGLNYRQHAHETGAKIPEYPVVFFKGENTLLNPGEAIQIPTHLRSDELDYE